jgi:hypothetical protein
MRRVDFAALPAVAAKCYHRPGAINRKITGKKSMAGKWMVVALGVGMITTLINAGIFVGQFSTSANARAAATAGSKLLDDEDFTAGLTKLIRKTVRDYCSVGKKEQIDC